MTSNILRRAGLAIVMVVNLTITPVSALRAQDQNAVSDGQGKPLQTAGEPSEADTAQTAVRKQIDEFFTQYEVATRADTADALLKLVDFEAFVDLVMDQAQIEIPDLVRRLLVNRLLQATRQEFGTVGDVWDRHRVIEATVFQDGKTVEAYVRSWSEDGESSRNVFWLEKSDRWHVIDWVNVDLGVRNSTLVSGIMRETYGTRQSNVSLQTMNLLNQVFVAARQQNIEAAHDGLNVITGRSIPNSLEGLRWIVKSSVSLYYDPFVTLESLDKAEAYEPEAVLADFLRLRAYFELGEHQRAIHRAERFLKRFGADDTAYLIKGLAHAELGQVDEALAAFEMGLEDNPRSMDLIIQYGSTLPEDQKAKIAHYVRALPDLVQSFEYLADEFEGEEEYSALKALLDIVASMGVDVPHLAYYEGIVLLGQGESAEAIEKLLTASSQLAPDDDYLSHYENAICRAAVHSSQVMRAYDTCQEKFDCFFHLITGLRRLGEDEKTDDPLRSKTEATIKELVAKHLTTHSTDSETFQILGDQAYYAKDYEKAKAHYESALKYYQSDDAPISILYDLIACHVETNSIVDIYQSSDFKRQVYDIARYRVAFDSEEYKELERLHQSNFPNLPDFVLSRMNTLYAESRYQESLDASESFENDEDNAYLLEQIHFIRVLCLARLGKYDDAIISARKLDDENRDRARAAIFVMRDDRIGFRGAVKRLIDSGDEWSREDFTMWVDVPDVWFEGLASKESDEDTPSKRKDFDPYQEIRRLVFLANEPISLDTLSIREAAAEVGLTVFEIHREQLLSEQDNYLCALSGDSVVVSSSGCKFFLMKRDGKFLNQLSSAGIEYEEDNEALQSRISEHTSWFSIDIFAWPQAADRDGPSAIPEDAVRNMIRLAEMILGGKATVVIHGDALVAVACDSDTFTRLKASPSLETLQPTDAMVGE